VATCLARVIWTSIASSVSGGVDNDFGTGGIGTIVCAVVLSAHVLRICFGIIFPSVLAGSEIFFSVYLIFDWRLTPASNAWLLIRQSVT
jgi:hypothetical protein